MISRSRIDIACKNSQNVEDVWKIAFPCYNRWRSWYLILKRYGINHGIVSGRIRNYVERVIETIKDRTRGINIDNECQRFHSSIAGGIFLIVICFILDCQKLYKKSKIIKSAAKVMISL